MNQKLLEHMDEENNEDTRPYDSSTGRPSILSESSHNSNLSERFSKMTTTLPIHVPFSKKKTLIDYQSHIGIILCCFILNSIMFVHYSDF